MSAVGLISIPYDLLIIIIITIIIIIIIIIIKLFERKYSKILSTTGTLIV